MPLPFSDNTIGKFINFNCSSCRLIKLLYALPHFGPALVGFFNAASIFAINLLAVARCTLDASPIGAKLISIS